MKSKQVHYAWKVVAACILIKLGTSGFTGVAMGNFVTPIVKELGCEVSTLTSYTNFNAIAMALLYTTAAKWLNTRHIGKIMGIASLAEVIGLALMATYRTPQMFYISGVIIGIGNAFTGFVALPIVINMWFRKNNGTVLGAVVAVGTAVSMLYSLLTAQLITHVGWRLSYVIMAVSAAVITIPAVFLLIKTPEQVGCLPYGAEEEIQESGKPEMSLQAGLTKREAFRLPLLYIAWVACVMYSYSCGVAGYTTTFATMELGQSIQFGAAVGVVSNLGGTMSSLIVGKINDRFGVKAGLMWGTLTTALGYGIMLLSFRNSLFVYPAIFMVGLGNSMYMVQCPLLARSIVGSKEYSGIWSLMMMVNSLIGGGLYSTIGLFYDKLGSFKGAFLMAIGFYTVASILGCISMDLSKKRTAAAESAASLEEQ